MSKSNPDLHIISVIDDQVDQSEKFSTMVKPVAQDKIISLDADAVNLFNSMGRLERLKQENAAVSVIRKEKSLIKVYRALAEEAMGKEVLAMVLNNKARVHLLIDSVGGSQIAGNPFISLMERATDTVAYISREASSLACNMVMQADRVYCLKDSYILWHLGRTNEDAYNTDSFDEGDFGDEEAISDDYPDEETAAKEMAIFQQEGDDENWGIFRDMIIGKCREEKRDDLDKKLDASVNVDRREVVFSGLELADYGIISGAFDTTAQLMEKFYEETGIGRESAPNKAEIRRFFKLAQMSEIVSRQAGFNCGMMIDHVSGKLTCRIVDEKDYTEENELRAGLIVASMIERMRRKR